MTTKNVFASQAPLISLNFVQHARQEKALLLDPVATLKTFSTSNLARSGLVSEPSLSSRFDRPFDRILCRYGIRHMAVACCQPSPTPNATTHNIFRVQCMVTFSFCLAFFLAFSSSIAFLAASSLASSSAIKRASSSCTPHHTIPTQRSTQRWVNTGGRRARHPA